MNSTAPSMRHAVRRSLLDPHWLEFAVSHVQPLWSTHRVRARLIGRFREARDVTSFVFQTNRRWSGFVPGQHVPLRLDIDGIVHERAYTLTGDPADAGVQITVRRHAAGIVSRYLHDRLRIGDRVDLGAPRGDFVLPAAPEPLLMIGGGIGITPLVALLREGLRRSPDLDVVLLHYVRSPRDAAFTGLLNEWSSRHLGLRVHTVLTGPVAARPGMLNGHLAAAHLEAVAPDVTRRRVFACGPATLLTAAAAEARRGGWANRLHRERFAPGNDGEPADTAPITYARSGLRATSTAATLLAAAEAAGLRPAHGCRMGICNTCRCRKISGSVRDLQSGAIDDRPDRDIRLCVSAATGPVTLDL